VIPGPRVDGHEVGVGHVLATVERVQARAHDVPRVFLAPLDVRSHPGIDRPNDQRDHLGALVGELGPGDAGQEQRGRLGRGVAAHERRREGTCHRQHVDDVAAAVGPEQRRERPGHVQHAEVVHLHLAARGVRVTGPHEPRVGEQPGVVDQQVHVQASARGGADRGGVGDVERHDLGRQPGEVVRQRVRVPHAGVDLLRPAGGQFLDERQADAAVRAGDERDRAGRLAGARHSHLRNVGAPDTTLQLQE
jgi:hypothetical protein